MVGLCHCRACQRRTGAVAASIAVFAADRVTVEGPRKIYERQGDSGRTVRFHFCPDCGSSLFCESEARPGFYNFAVGAFADPGFPPPTVSIFEASKHDWLQVPAGTKHFEGAITGGS